MTQAVKAVVAVLVAAICVTLVACGSSTNTESDEGSGATASQAAPTGPIRLGYVVPDWTTLIKTTGRRDQDAEQMMEASKREMQALVDWANETGGIGGRRIVATPYEVEQTATADQLNAACSEITEDGREQVFIDTSIFTNEQAWSCFAEHGTAYVGIVTATDSGFVESVAPYVASVYAPVDVQMTAMARLLEETRFLDGARVGVVLEDTPVLKRSYENVLGPALRAAGVDPVVRYVDPSDTAAVNNTVLAFKDAGVDRVIGFINIIGFLAFTNQAEAQDYRPKYAWPDFQAINQVAAQNGNPRQLAGSIAVSSIEGFNGIAHDASRLSTDQQSAIKPNHVPPAQIECRRVIGERLGTDYLNPGQAGTSTFEMSYCDNFQLWLEAARALGKEWTPQRFGESLEQLGDGYRSSRMHAVDYSDGTLGGPAAFAAGVYDERCRCFVRTTEWMPID